MNLRNILLIPFVIFCTAAMAEEPYVNDMSAGTSISGPTDEQEAMFSPSAAFEGYVNNYVSSAMNRELEKNVRSLNSLSAQVAKLKKELEEGKFDSALNAMNRNDAARFQQAVNNPKIVEKMMSSPQAKALYEKLSIV